MKKKKKEIRRHQVAAVRKRGRRSMMFGYLRRETVKGWRHEDREYEKYFILIQKYKIKVFISFYN